MPIRYPPRREPRVLALATIPAGLVFAVVDPWVVRGTGQASCGRRTRSAAILRLVRRCYQPRSLSRLGTFLIQIDDVFDGEQVAEAIKLQDWAQSNYLV